MGEETDYVAKQPYIKVIREVNSIEKREIEHERNMYLWEDKLTTAHREFKLADVLDLSFKKVAGAGGILFLHTDHAVYTYIVKSSPMEFVEICKRYIGKAL